MNIYSLVFSNKSGYRIARHAIFWLVWIAYYTAITTYAQGDRFPFLNRLFFSLSTVTLTTPIDMIFCYTVIYFLLPKVLFKGRYISMIVLWLLFSLICIIVFEIYNDLLTPVVKGWFDLPVPEKRGNYFWMSFSLFSQINMEGCIAASIKLGKILFINQKEVELLKKEKASAKPATDITEMQPVFLASVIKRIELMAIKKEIDIPRVLRQIGNMMTNIMHENTNAKISLKRELELVKEYIELEQSTRDEPIDVNFNVSEINESETIASLMLLQFIQNAFNQISYSNVSDKKIDIDIRVVDKILQAKIRWNKPGNTSTLTEGKNIVLHNLNDRLKLIYPGSNQIKMKIEVEWIAAFLKIDLKGAIN